MQAMDTVITDLSIYFGSAIWRLTPAMFNRLWPGSVFFFRGTHNVRDELQLSHFVG